MGGKGSDKDAIEFAVENGYRPAKLGRDPRGIHGRKSWGQVEAKLTERNVTVRAWRNRR